MDSVQSAQNAAIRETFVKPRSQQVRLISHSNIFYWWPAWLTGYAVALFTSLEGKDIAISADVVERFHPSNNPGIFFITTLVLLVVFTTTKLRGIYSAITLVTLAFFFVLFAWFGWWDEILRIVPQLSARANVGFYLLFSTALLVVWLLAFFVFDRSTIWRIVPGQMIEERLVGGQARSYDTAGLVFEKKGQDLFHDILLGLGAGDLRLKIGGTNQQTIEIPNVLFVDRKVRAIERLVSVKPDQVQNS